ncbi:MAG: TolC family protein, partial [Candidatus Hydrogenedentes bacterium]|nr:TolC family protein [Candidatus Hydrogenedentota bacterium]
AIASWYQEAVAAYEETVKLNEDALPVAEDAFESVRLGYDGGKFGYIEVLNAQSTLFDLRVRLLEAYSAYHQATVEIERLLGQPLDRYREIYGSSVGEEVNAP